MLLDVSEAGDSSETVRIFATHDCTICDFAALKELLCSMGQSGLKPCPKCSNIVKDDLALCDLLPLSSLEYTRWKKHTDQSLRDIQSHMRRERTRITKTAFGELETRMGFHFSEHAVVNDTALNYRSISTLNFDWVHIYFSSGLFTREIEAFVAKARELAGKGKPALVSYADLHDYLQLWHVPACWASCKTIFVKGSMAATASEQLSAAPLLRNFFENVVMREPSLSQLHEAARSAALVCAAVEKLQCATRKLVGRPELRQAICDHLARHQRVHGTEWWTLKDHLALHLPDQEELFDTFVTERRHKDPKRFARLALRTSMKGYNKGLMEELVCQHFHDWNQFRPEDALVAPHAVPKRLQGPLRDIFPTAYNIQISQQFRGADGRKIHAGDVALLGAARGHSCCKIWYHVNVDGVPWTCLELWPLQGAIGPRCKKYRVETAATILPSTDIKASVSYMLEGEFAIVRLPLYYMYKESLI